jgi:hypothetical protein
MEMLDGTWSGQLILAAALALGVGEPRVSREFNIRPRLPSQAVRVWASG